MDKERPWAAWRPGGERGAGSWRARARWGLLLASWPLQGALGTHEGGRNAATPRRFRLMCEPIEWLKQGLGVLLPEGPRIQTL